MVTRAYGVKQTTFTQEEDLGNGLRKAGTGQITYFIMDKLDETNIGFWEGYARAMKQEAVGTRNKDQTDIAIKGFQNALSLHGTKNCEVFIAYSTLDPGMSPCDSAPAHKTIQMVMTVVTNTAPSYFAVTHMGIFRSPLLEKSPGDYGSTSSKGISKELHSFAARAIRKLKPNYRASMMITAPVEHMGGILADFRFPNGELTHAATGPVFDRKLEITQRGKSKIVVKTLDAPWLFQLSFNPSHAYPPSFIDHERLCNHCEDLQVTVCG